MLSERFTNAIELAAELHSKQLRKGTNIPYVSHLLGVTSLVLEHGGNEDEAIANSEKVKSVTVDKVEYNREFYRLVKP